ncbi:hypothetical protein [Burkholderia territorii]|uniref:hypothetical protein n=1 Tax=Burkholderia territorii TaxID=1503055 RepID=UPI001E3B634F|nr:hypothetical protein [Burkholderia territorii]
MLVVCAAACCVPTQPAHAQHARHVPRQDFRGRDFHGRDFRHFAPRERTLWQRGRWVQDWHGGRYAWWWVVDGYWYIYPEPMYPYPTYIPPAIVVQRPPPTPARLPPARVVLLQRPARILSVCRVVQWRVDRGSVDPGPRAAMTEATLVRIAVAGYRLHECARAAREGA